MHNYLNTINEIISQINAGTNDYWKSIFKSIGHRNIHLAIMIEPYLSLILDGSKTIESRISKNMIVPHHKVYEGDIIILKKSGGPICGIFEAGIIHFFSLNNSFTIDDLKKQYNHRLLIKDNFWSSKAKSNYATLIEVKHILGLAPVLCHVANRKSWIILTDSTANEVSQMSFYNGHNDISSKIICIIGKVASGKTTIATKVSEKLGCNHFSVSDYLKAIAKNRGYLTINREILQKIGEECIEQGWDRFAHDFLCFTKYTSKNNIVIDGIRHKEFYSSLKEIASNECFLIYLETNDDVINNRMITRGEKYIDYSHVAEGRIDELIGISDYTLITSNRDADSLTNELLQFLKL